MKRKISIIIPTYNDGKTITETFNSIINQSYSNYEVIIIDDGSTDNTKEIVEKFIKTNKIDNFYYYYQTNKDQLNAVKTAIPQITGDYIMILHSDDLLSSDDLFAKAIEIFKQNEVDAIIGDLVIINEKSEVVALQKVAEYTADLKIIPLQLLWLGRNLFSDTAIFKKEIFINQVYHNYLTWNMPFWLNSNESVSMLNVKKIDFPLIQYRVHENNYINNELGKLNVINGELRVVTRLMIFYHIPLYKLQYFIFRLANKFKIKYQPFYLNKETKNKEKIVKFVIEKRFNNNNNIFLKNLILFYNNNKHRSIKVDIKENDYIYLGSDMRLFNQKLLNNNLDKLYKEIITEMAIGFDTIIVSKGNYEKALNITKFLCIYPYVKIIEE